MESVATRFESGLEHSFRVTLRIMIPPSSGFVDERHPINRLIPRSIRIQNDWILLQEKGTT